MKVKCIDVSGLASDKLTEGHVYSVLEDDGATRVYTLVDVPGYWNRNRFEIIDGEPIENVELAVVVGEPQVDHEEERIWKLFRRRVAPGNCNCDIPRDQCNLHRP